MEDEAAHSAHDADHAGSADREPSSDREKAWLASPPSIDDAARVDGGAQTGAQSSARGAVAASSSEAYAHAPMPEEIPVCRFASPRLCADAQDTHSLRDLALARAMYYAEMAQLAALERGAAGASGAFAASGADFSRSGWAEDYLAHGGVGHAAPSSGGFAPAEATRRMGADFDERIMPSAPASSSSRLRPERSRAQQQPPIGAPAARAPPARLRGPRPAGLQEDTGEVVGAPVGIARGSPRPRGRGGRERDAVGDGEHVEGGDRVEESTTVSLRNFPDTFVRDSVEHFLNSHGFHGRFDFVYYPMRFQKSAGNSGFCYAIVNFLTREDVAQVQQRLHGFCDWDPPCRKVLEVKAAILQNRRMYGLADCIARYRNSPIMNRSMPDAFKPAVYKHGRRVEFPLPGARS
mmetsp:Transcript_110324/g.308389  ORF Transcript_110324/g.308389 Transcript_110324/m.308389 type:complete len:407 (+) Transcript_110324:103-1323(+)